MGSTASEKYDVKRDRRELYGASAQDFSIVDVPPMTYLAVDGRGDPNTAAEYADDPETFVTRQRDAWSWTMLIAQPDQGRPARPRACARPAPAA